MPAKLTVENTGGTPLAEATQLQPDNSAQGETYAFNACKVLAAL